MGVTVMRLRAQRNTAAWMVAGVLAAGLVACQSGSQDSPERPARSTPSAAAEEEPEPVRVTTSFSDATQVPIEGAVTVSTQGAELTGVRLSSAAGDVTGDVTGGTWTSTDRLEPGTDYVMTSTAQRSDGSSV
ncbi:MAG: Ig-like domain-containing protein, partial [Nocardioides sp.]|nr:Ig-like domain-containing protein [Nocardioides sp.]